MTVVTALEQRQQTLEDPNVPINTFTLLDALGGGPAAFTGRRVNQNTARKNAALYNAVTLSSGWVGMLPLKLFRRRADGGKDEAPDHPSAQVSRRMPNPRMSAMTFKEVGQTHLLTRGNFYAEKVRERASGRITTLWPLNPDRTRFDTDRGEYITVIGNTEMALPPDRVLHIRGPGGDGIHGWSVIKLFRETIGLGLAMEEYAARFFGNSSTPRGVLTSPERLSKEAQARLKTSWERAQGGLDNAHRVAVLEEGLEFQAIGLSAEDAQFIEGRTFHVQDIARIFNIPPSKLKDTSRSTFNNVESENLNAVIDHLQPWATRWEQEFTNQCLPQSDIDAGFFFEFQLQGLLRGDMEARGSYFESRVRTRSITPDEIRAFENENPLPGELGNEIWVQMQDVPMSVAASMSPTERALVLAAASENGDAVRHIVELRKYELGKGDGHAVETKALPTDAETRQATTRQKLRDTFLPLLLDAFGRLVRAEVSDLRDALRSLFEGEGLQGGELVGADGLMAFLRFFYDRDGPIAGLLERTLFPTFRSFARAVFSELGTDLNVALPDARVDEFLDGPNGYLRNFRDRYSASGRAQLQRLVEQGQSPDTDFGAREAVEQRLTEWVDGTDAGTRAEKWSRGESVQLGEAGAVAAMAAGGILLKRWVTVGQNCPMCNALDGSVVGVRDTFANAGETVVGTDNETEITKSGIVRHPPLHRGCDCIVVAGA